MSIFNNSKPFLFIVIILAIFSCNKESENGPEQLEYQWISGIPFTINYPFSSEEIEHDDRILETDHFLVFSDASSDEVKTTYAEFAEKAFEGIKIAFDIESSQQLGIDPDNVDTKITIFSDRYLNYSNIAFPNGFLLIALDAPAASSWFEGNEDELKAWYKKDVKHETMHVFQWLLGLDWDNTLSWNDRVGRTWPDFWFSEGISEYISSGSFAPIENMDQVNAWFQNLNHINPISIHLSEDAPVSDSYIGEYYPMFGLAVRYLIEDENLDNSFIDVKEMYLDMQNTANFHESFETYMGISVEYYEEHFLDLISAFFENTN